MNQLQIKDVTITFDQGQNRKRSKPLYENFNYSFEGGNIYAFVGKSGCGKTTLMRMIDGLGQRDSGTIILNGKRHELSTDVVMVFQDYPLYPWKSVIGNVLMGYQAIRKNITPKEKLDAAALLERLHIPKEHHNKRVGRYNNQISGGQAQRVSIAKSIMITPTVLLLDEPTSALDEESTELVSELLKEYCQKHQAIIIVITHDDRFLKGLGAISIDLSEDPVRCTKK